MKSVMRRLMQNINEHIDPEATFEVIPLTKSCETCRWNGVPREKQPQYHNCDDCRSNYLRMWEKVAKHQQKREVE